jgi:hypothetical protein
MTTSKAIQDNQGLKTEKMKSPQFSNGASKSFDHLYQPIQLYASILQDLIPDLERGNLIESRIVFS